MVDLLDMFRRRPAKRGPPGFARSRAADITALGDSIGDMLTSPVRDAPPIARDAPLVRHARPGRELPPPNVEPARPEKSRPPRAKVNGATAPRLAPRAGYLAVH